MIPEPDWTAELEALLERLIDGEFDAADRTRLNVLLTQGEAPRRYYRGYMRLHHGLEWRISEPTLRQELCPPQDQYMGQRPGMAGSPAIDVSVGEAVELPSGQWSRTPNPEPRTPNPEPPFPVLSTTNYPLPTSDFVGSWAFSCMVATVIMGVMLLVFWAMKVTHHQHIAEAPSQSVPSDVGSEMVFVGRITGMVDVKWSDDPHYLPPLGAYVSLGRKYKLDSGLMEITYDSGAKVILEGPCTYEVESENGGYLALGKLTARVEKKRSEVRGQKSDPSPLSPLPSPLFSVRTPTAVVTDLGTEFGVEVSEEGTTTSHVFRGSVNVRVIGDGEQQGVVLHKNESARVQRDKDAEDRLVIMHDAVGNPPVFVRRLVHPPKVLDLLDIVAGGYGTRWDRERGIDPTTGMEDPLFVMRYGRGDNRYRPVAFRGGLIDGVFVPDGRAGSVQLDSAGHTFDGFPYANGTFHGSIWARAADVAPKRLDQRWPPWVYVMGRCEQFMPKGRGLLCLHANVGITFDLEAVRKMYPGERPARFQAVAGLGDCAKENMEGGMADLWVFVDGRLKLERRQLRPRDGAVVVDVKLGLSDRFLTLVSTDGDNESHGEWGVFGDPVLQMASTESEESADDGTERVETDSPSTPRNRKEGTAMNGP